MRGTCFVRHGSGRYTSRGGRARVICLVGFGARSGSDNRFAPLRVAYCSPMPRRPSSKPPAAAAERIVVAGREVALSNPGKVLFAEAGHTKLDLVRYYL